MTTSSKANAMREKLSQVGRRHAALAPGAEVAADPALTPAPQILGDAETRGGRYEPDGPPPTLGPNPRPLPEPASETELDALRYQLRAAIAELMGDETRLAALQQPRERARAEHHAAAGTVSDAEAGLREARLHSRAHVRSG